jgi:hypothetical protein
MSDADQEHARDLAIGGLILPAIAGGVGAVLLFLWPATN